MTTDKEYERDIERALKTLRNGGIILYPTETIWGIGCDATLPDAVKRIFSIKRRADGKAMISLVDSLEMLEKWVTTVPDAARRAIDTAKGPLSIIFDHPIGIADELRAEDGSAAFRITTLPLAAHIVRELGHPLVSTSANISGAPSAMTFIDIDQEIKESVDYILEHGQDRTGATPSSVLKITDKGEVTRLR